MRADKGVLLGERGGRVIRCEGHRSLALAAPAALGLGASASHNERSVPDDRTNQKSAAGNSLFTSLRRNQLRLLANSQSLLPRVVVLCGLSLQGSEGKPAVCCE